MVFLAPKGRVAAALSLVSNEVSFFFFSNF